MGFLSIQCLGSSSKTLWLFWRVGSPVSLTRKTPGAARCTGNYHEYLGGWVSTSVSPHASRQLLFPSNRNRKPMFSAGDRNRHRIEDKSRRHQSLLSVFIVDLAIIYYSPAFLHFLVRYGVASYLAVNELELIV